MKNLILISAILMLSGCCTLARYKDLMLIETRRVTREELAPVLRADFNKALFKAKIRVYGNYFSGLMMIKKMPDSSVRISFITETGFKFFDFEFNGDKTTVHYCIKEFDKKSVLRTIESDMKLILMNDLKLDEVSVFTDTINKYGVYKMKYDSDYNYYFIENGAGKLVKIENSSKRFKNVIIDFNEYDGGLPGRINISHQNFRLNIELIAIKGSAN